MQAIQKVGQEFLRILLLTTHQLLMMRKRPYVGSVLA